MMNPPRWWRGSWRRGTVVVGVVGVVDVVAVAAVDVDVLPRVVVVVWRRSWPTILRTRNVSPCPAGARERNVNGEDKWCNVYFVVYCG